MFLALNRWELQWRVMGVIQLGVICVVTENQTITSDDDTVKVQVCAKILSK